MTRRDFVDRATGMLTPRYGQREAGSIVRLVMESLCGVTRTDIALDPVAALDDAAAGRAVERIAAGEPVQYVLGEAWFCGERFEVGPDVLIPRPETEELVEWIVREHGPQRGLRALDIGTGSGAIAVMLALRLPAAQVTATDISSGALAVAARNALRFGARIGFVRGDALEGLPAGEFDVTVSNPPYIPQSERAAMAAHVTGHEPAGALFVPDHDPLRFYRAIARGTRGGWIYFEVHDPLAGEVCAMLAGENCTEIELRQDIHGKPRMVRCRKQ